MAPRGSATHRLRLTEAAAARAIPLADRFWASVDIRGPDECWPWLGRRLPRGYGVIAVGREKRRAHRVAWELTCGAIPAGLNVCHRCDHPPCCNPAHLVLWTQAENMADAAAKGRLSNDRPRRRDGRFTSSAA